MASKMRLDALLAQRGLFETRSRAAASVLAGEVRIGAHGARASKPGALVATDVQLSVDEVPRFVSRGGIKLANALAASALDVGGRRCLDIGASTGGFTDCLLQAGAAAVVALDVAYGELSWKLRGDPRVTVIERFNARELRADVLPYAPELIVADVSFISLRLLLAPLLACAAPRFDALLLVKPQFEVGRGLVGRGGVVRDGALRRGALLETAAAAAALGASVRGFHSSGLPGPKGNIETFLALAEGARGSVADLPALALEADSG
ncbi:MAG TPA: TlyA family rRNA (cytidine-2'-O)-methyltransferase [Solirubrobacteraceae bacterium]|nr:TlyA family rRNA (cytidine-2'-O)-methyltransferase [Solirubrobacteraceae bacterium]